MLDDPPLLELNAGKGGAGRGSRAEADPGKKAKRRDQEDHAAVLSLLEDIGGQ